MASVPTSSDPELDMSLHSWCCLRVTQAVRNNSEHEFNLVRASHLTRKGIISFRQVPTYAKQHLGRIARAPVDQHCSPAAGRGVRTAISNAGSTVRNLSGQELLWGSSLHQSLAPACCAICMWLAVARLKESLSYRSLCKLNQTCTFLFFLSLHRSFSLSLQRAFVRSVSGTTEERRVEEDALLLS